MSDMTNDYTWTATAGGDWADPSNWADITTGQTPAVTSPGSLDTATISGALDVSGTGAVGILTLVATPTLAGSFNFGTVDAPSGAAMSGQISADSLEAGGTLSLSGGTLTVTDLNAATLVTSGLINAGALSAQSFAMQWSSTDTAIGDSGPGVAIGSDGIDSNTALQIASGHTAAFGTLDLNNQTWAELVKNAVATVVVDGRFSVSDASIGGYGVASDQPGGSDSQLDTDVVGNGVIEVMPSGTLDFIGTMSGPDLTIQLDGNATFILQGDMGGGTTFQLLGTSNTIEVVAPYQSTTADGYPSTYISAVIDGMNSGDVLQFNNLTPPYGNNSVPPPEATNTNAGVDLSLGTDGTISIDGSFTAASFQTTTIATPTYNGPPAFSSFGELNPYSGTYIFDVTMGAGSTQTLACFSAGTRLATQSGQVPVEELSRGTNLRTISRSLRPIRWVGCRSVDCRRHPNPERVWPVRIAANAFGKGLPVSPIYVSPDHAIYIDGIFVPVKYLINDSSIVQVEREQVTYYHVELGSHDVILAEGLPCESYLDTGDRSNFANSGTGVRLFPDFAEPAEDIALLWESKACAPLVIHGPRLNIIRRLVNRRAEVFMPAGIPRPRSAA